MTSRLKQGEPPLGVAMYVGADPRLRGRIGQFYESITDAERKGYSRVDLWFVCGTREHRVDDGDLLELEERSATFVRKAPVDLAGKRVWFAAIPMESTNREHPPGSVIIFRDTSEVIASGENVLPLRVEKSVKATGRKSKIKEGQRKWKGR